MISKRLCLVMLVSGLMAGCGGTVKPSAVTLTSLDEEKYANISPMQMTADAEALLKKAYAEEFNVYAPATLALMEKQVRDLAAQVQKGKADRQQSILMSKGVEQTFNSGKANKALVLSQLSDVWAQKKVLDELNASQSYPGDYKDAVEDIIDLVKYIEAGKPDKARGGTPGVLEDMQQLEIRIIKDQILTKAKTLIGEAEDKDGDDNAPKAFAEAEQAYERAKTLIETKPRDRDEIKRLGGLALFYAKRAVWMADEVAKLREIKPKEMEGIALEAERRQQKIAEGMQLGDIRDQSLTEQSATLVAAGEKLIKQLAEHTNETGSLSRMEGELATVKQERAALQSRVAELETENRGLREKLTSLTKSAPADSAPGLSEAAAAGAPESADAVSEAGGDTTTTDSAIAE